MARLKYNDNLTILKEDVDDIGNEKYLCRYPSGGHLPGMMASCGRNF